MNKCWFNLFVSNMQGGNNINVNNKKNYRALRLLGFSFSL